MPTTTANDQSATSVPGAAAILGALGALPFVAAASAAMLGVSLPVAEPLALLLGYGAVILSFMGGVHWGLAMRDGTGVPQPGGWSRFSVSVLPALVAWCALLVPQHQGLVILAAAFAALLAYDLAAVRSGAAPQWYPRLRWPLSAIVIGCLAAVAIAA